MMVRLVVFCLLKHKSGDMVNIGRNPASTSGSVFNVNFVYALKEDNSKFVEFIVKATLE